MLRIVFKTPGQSPVVRETEDSLENMQGLVGGYIEAIYLPNDFILIVNEEGKLHDLPRNILLPNGDVVVGSCFIVKGNAEGDFASLTTHDQMIALSLLNRAAI